MARARLPLLLGSLLALPALAACGSERTAAPASVTESTVSEQVFPRPAGMTLAQLASSMPSGPQLAPAAGRLRPGTDRVAFTLLDPSRRQITAARVAVYVSHPSGSGVRGPYLARPAATGPNYVVVLPFARRGRMMLTALVRLDGRLMATPAVTVAVAGRASAHAG